MNTIKLSFRMFSRSPVINMIISLQIIAVFFLCGSLISSVEQQISAKIYLRPSLKSRFVYYMPESYRALAEGYSKETFARAMSDDELMNTYDKIKSVGHSVQLDFSIVSSENSRGNINYISTHSYNTDMVNGIKQNMYKGKWLAEVKSEDGLIPIVVSKGSLPVETVFTAVNHTNGLNLKFKVTGIAEHPFYYLNSGKGGDALGTESLLKIAKNSYSDQAFGIFNYEDVNGISIEKFDKYNNRYLYFPDELSQDEYKDILTGLKIHALTAESSNLLYADRENIAYILKTELPETITAFIIALISISMTAVINTQNMLPVFRIYYICGCKRSMCKKIVFGFTLIIIGTALSAILLFFLFESVTSLFSEFSCRVFNFSYLNFCVFMLIALFFSLISTFTANRIIKNESHQKQSPVAHLDNGVWDND